MNNINKRLNYENIFISISLVTAYIKGEKTVIYQKNKVTLRIVQSIHVFISDVADDIFADYGLSAA